jgi:hypothetical protein
MKSRGIILILSMVLAATPDKERYNLRDTGKVRLQVTDAEGNPVRADDPGLAAICMGLG